MTEKIKSGNGLKRTGIILLITGTLASFLLLGLLPSLLPPPTNTNAVIVNILATVIPAPIMLVGAFLYWRGRQYADKAVAEKVMSDSKAHVLYLRGFGTDPSIGKYLGLEAWGAGVMSGWLTIEEQLGEVLRSFGDLLAIGKPGETLPTPGAARLYASDAEWKKVVIDQMQNARLVVIRAGTSEGLLWELKEAIQVVNPKKLLILILMGKKQYEAFRKEADQIFNATFPKVHELKRFWRVNGFVRFSPNWSPNFLPLHAPFFSRFGYKPYCRLLRFTLRPVFEEYGLEWKPQPVSIPIVLTVVIFVGFGVLILLAILLAIVFSSH
jgi:hypothetical protein